MTAPPVETPSTLEKPRWGARILAGIGGLAAAGVSPALAVWDKAAPPETPRVERGQAVEAGRWTVTLISAHVADRTPDGRPVRGGGAAVSIDMMLENRTASTTNLFSDVVRIAGLPAGVETRPTLYLARDKEMLGWLQPRLAKRVTAVWVWPGSGRRR